MLLDDGVAVSADWIGINDQAVTWTFEHYERMLRALLDLPSKPAIIYAESVIRIILIGRSIWPS